MSPMPPFPKDYPTLKSAGEVDSPCHLKGLFPAQGAVWRRRKVPNL